MIGTVVNTLVYPIKGMQGVEMTTRGIQADKKIGIIGDRNYAIYRKSTGAPTTWKKKGFFHACVNREGMATKVGKTGLLEADLDDQYTLDPDWVGGMLQGRDLPMDHSTLVHTRGKYHLADTNKPCISFLNLASVRDLEQKAGVRIDPRRFRMNFWIDGLEPWAELDYVTAWQQGERFPMWAGNTLVYCDDMCERCRAIEQSPETGEWDINLLALLEATLQDRGYQGSPQRGKMAVMGWLGIPQSNGKIKVGDKLTFGTN